VIFVLKRWKKSRPM